VYEVLNGLMIEEQFAEELVRVERVSRGITVVGWVAEVMVRMRPKKEGRKKLTVLSKYI
jgi:hypothetical protein